MGLSKGHSPSLLCFRNRPTFAEGFNLSHSAGTIHGRSSLNGLSHPDSDFEKVGVSKALSFDCVIGRDCHFSEAFSYLTFGIVF